MTLPSGSTLHLVSGYLSLAGVVLCFGSITGVMFVVMMRLRKREIENSKRTAKRSTATLDKSETPEQQSLAAKLNLKFNTILTQIKRRRVVVYLPVWDAIFFLLVFFALVYVIVSHPVWLVQAYHDIQIEAHP
jgi:hypothetical protein